MMDDKTQNHVQARTARLEVDRFRMQRYSESSTVRLRIRPTPTSALLPISFVFSSCPFCWKYRLNSVESILKQLSWSTSQFSEISSSGKFSSRNTVTDTKYSATISPILSLRWVSSVSVKLRMLAMRRRAVLLAAIA